MIIKVRKDIVSLGSAGTSPHLRFFFKIQGDPAPLERLPSTLGGYLQVQRSKPGSLCLPEWTGPF